MQQNIYVKPIELVQNITKKSVKVNCVFDSLSNFIVGVYGEQALSTSRFGCLKSDDFVLEYKERPGQLKKFEGEELVLSLNVDQCNTL